MIPDELILNIYNFCDIPTRININRAFGWNYKLLNPYKDTDFSILLRNKKSEQFIGCHV